jgi:hypothetical protein
VGVAGALHVAAGWPAADRGYLAPAGVDDPAGVSAQPGPRRVPASI